MLKREFLGLLDVPDREDQADRVGLQRGRQDHDVHQREAGPPSGLHVGDHVARDGMPELLALLRQVLGAPSHLFPSPADFGGHVGLDPVHPLREVVLFIIEIALCHADTLA